MLQIQRPSPQKKVCYMSCESAALQRSPNLQMNMDFASGSTGWECARSSTNHPQGKVCNAFPAKLGALLPDSQNSEKYYMSDNMFGSAVILSIILLDEALRSSLCPQLLARRPSSRSFRKLARLRRGNRYTSLSRQPVWRWLPPPGAWPKRCHGGASPA